MSEEKEAKRRKKRDSKTAQRPASARRKSSGASRSAFPNAADMSAQVMRKKINEMETTIKSLTRDNKVLARKIEKMESQTGKKNKKIDAEKDMRLNANKERYWLKQKLDRLQKAIEARLKLLGIDFSNINDLSEALEAAFAAIQKLAAELAKKEEELQQLADKYEKAKAQREDALKDIDKLKSKVAKAKNANDDLRKRLADKDKDLDSISKQQDSMNDKEKAKQQEIDKLRKELDALRAAKNKQFDNFVDKKAEWDKQLRQKDDECKQLSEELDGTKKQRDKLEAANEKLQEQLEKLRNVMDKQTEKLMEAKEKNKQLEADNEELKNELDDEKKKNEDLEAKNKALEDELAKLKALLAAKEKELADKNDAYVQLEKEKKENEEKMQAMFDEQKQMAEMLKKKMAQLEKQLKEKEATISNQDEELSSMKQALEDERKEKEALQNKLKEATKDSESTMDALSEEKKALRDMMDKLKGKMKDKEDEIAKLKKALADAEQKLKDYMNRERDDKCVQTELSGKWIDNARMQLANLDNIFKENEELRRLASKNDDRLLELAEENRLLIDEIDMLLKQQAQFRPDTSNHRGEVLAMCAAPNTYYAATSATDKSVRLWQIDPSQEKSKDQVKPVYRAQMEGVALSLAYTRDGTYLVAGCAYKNGPDGLLIVWNMSKGDGEVEFLFRSRPSVRFGRAHCVRWSDDSQYIFSGDTTGSVWVWDVVNNVQLAEVRAHKDVVHDIGVARNALFSCGLDQSISVFNLDQLLGDKGKKKKKKVKKDKVHVYEPAVFKSKQVNLNERYPYWVVQPTEDATQLLAGARKLWNFKFTGFPDDDAKKSEADGSLQKGPRVADTDTEHVESVQVRRGQVVISRRDLPKAKIFSTSNGSEVAKAKFKAPVKRIQFTFDNQHCVVCTQKQDGKKAKPPGMHLWNYKK